MPPVTYNDYARLKRGDIVEFDNGKVYTVVTTKSVEDGLWIVFNQAETFVRRKDELRPFKVVGYHRLPDVKLI